MQFIAAVIVGLTAAAENWSYPAYCAKVNEDLVALRSIPTINIDQGSKLKLNQVLIVARHGARTPADRFNCWANYNPNWNCDVDLAIQGVVTNTSGNDSSVGNVAQFIGRTHYPYSAIHSKRYDVNPEMNVLGGSCQKGQLLREGFDQHQLIGHYLAKAYQVPHDEHRVPAENAPPLLDLSKADEQVYFRSSDMQRTIISGSSLLASFFTTASEGETRSIPMIPLHTMDLARETLFPNTAVCPALIPIRDSIFGSSGYLDLRAKWNNVEDELKKATGRSDISDVWPGELFDCVLTSLCSGHLERLPEQLHPTAAGIDGNKSLIDALLQTVDDYAQFEYKFEQASFSKAAIAYAMVDLKSEIIRALMQQALDLNLNATESLATMIGSRLQSEAYIEHLTASNQYRTFSETATDSKRLVLFAGHDTTIMPLLASLEGTVYDDKWPPYASEVVIEIFHEIENPLKVLFRLVYNGSVLTRNLPGCTQIATAGSTELCPISVFFEATHWATPSGAKKLCAAGLGVRETITSAEERWLLRKRLPSSQTSSFKPEI